MTTFGRSPVSGSSLRRRSLLLGGVGGAAALTTLGHSGTAGAQPAEPAQIDFDFDFDTGNAIDFFFATAESIGGAPSEALIASMDATVNIWLQHLETIAWFDAVAPYHPTAVGVYTRIGRRPASESATNRNLNIAIFHAMYQWVKAVNVEQVPLFAQVMTALGVDPHDESEDPTSPVGIGNLAGKGAVAARVRDGMNLLGDEGRRYSPRPFLDYTGYRPVNTAYELVNPSRWQPQLTPHRRRLGAGVGDKGIFTIQQFVTPQMRLTKPYTFEDPRQFHIAPPSHSDHHRHRRYKRSVDEVVEASAALTDEQKVKAEFFDNKSRGIGRAPIMAARNRPELGVHGWVQMFLTYLVAIVDVLIAVWYQKAKYDSVRPVSAVAHVYGSSPVTAWGGVGMGTVNDLPADEWASYLNVADHPEYPSASAASCSAQAQSLRRFFGDDVLEWRFPVRAGSTLAEAGITPASDVELYWATWTDFVNDCANSRLWGGVHFPKTQERSVPFAEQFGDLAYEFVQRHVNGDVED
jgi:hypothetical protein